jgi:hypothetical protein
VGPRAVWTGAENLAPTGIRSPDRPARSQSLYRLRYPAYSLFVVSSLFIAAGSNWLCSLTGETI